MAGRAKKHHIVPEVLQKHFAIEGDEKRVWRAKRNGNGKFPTPERKLIGNTFVIRDYYTVLENEKRSDLVERQFYGEVDDFLGRVLPKLIVNLNRGDPPSFSRDSLDSLRKAVMAMAKRTPDFHKDLDDAELGKELVQTTLDALPDASPQEYRQILKADLTDPTALRDRGRHARVRATILDSPRVNKALSDFVPRWSISETKHSYILSSMMVYRIGNQGSNGLLNPNMEMWMPITPKVSLVLLRDPHNIVPHITFDSVEHIRKVNEFAVRNSFEIASHSEELLKSLIGK